MPTSSPAPSLASGPPGVGVRPGPSLLKQRPGPGRGAGAPRWGGPRSDSPREGTCRSWDCKSSLRWGWRPAWLRREAAAPAPGWTPLRGVHASIQTRGPQRRASAACCAAPADDALPGAGNAPVPGRGRVAALGKGREAAGRGRVESVARWRGHAATRIRRWPGTAVRLVNLSSGRKPFRSLPRPQGRGPGWGGRCWLGWLDGALRAGPREPSERRRPVREFRVEVYSFLPSGVSATLQK